MPQSTLEFERFSLNLAEHRLLRDGQPVPLTPKVFDLLRVLVENAGHLVEKNTLLKEVWGDAFVEEANLNRGISVLRKALGEGPTETYIETVPKRGYRFVAPVRASPDGARTVAGTPPSIVDGRPIPPAARSTRGWRLATLAIAAAAVLLVAAGGYAVLGRRAPSNQAVATTASIHRQLTFTGKEITPDLSPDGTRIAYVSAESRRRKVMVQELGGGKEAVEVFSAPEAGALRWSPDSSELMFWARGEGTNGLFIAPASGAGARKVAEGLLVTCWSPDGSMLARALHVARKIMFLNRLGEVQRSISLQGLAQGWIWDLDWSPVHDRLLFVASDEHRRPAIWTIQPDGREQTKILAASMEVSAARWAPAGDAIYYFGRVNRTYSLHKVLVGPDHRTTEHSSVPLISGLEADASLGLSAEGKRLVYTRSPYYSNLSLVEADSDGSRPIRETQLTHGTAIVERPRVSPDGHSIVFNMGDDSRANLYTIPVSGGSPKQLTFLNAFSVGGAWSRDGRSVGFASTEGGKPRVWVVNADGTMPRPLSNGNMSDAFDVTWSPGLHLLYEEAGNRNLYVLDPQTRQERLLIKDSSVGWAGYAAYSPDGRKVAVSWNRRPARGLWMIDCETSLETLIHKPLDPDSNPFPIGWSLDGTFIYAVDGKRAADRGVSVSFRETITDARILRVPVNGGRPETILSLPFNEVGTVAMFADGRRFVVSVYSSRSDVWLVENFDASAESKGARR
jgi:Tol biopolymer transport system component/DNA-binding winged helix-turn-helix (wHTH) protein